MNCSLSGSRRGRLISASCEHSTGASADEETSGVPRPAANESSTGGHSVATTQPGKGQEDRTGLIEDVPNLKTDSSPRSSDGKDASAADVSNVAPENIPLPPPDHFEDLAETDVPPSDESKEASPESKDFLDLLRGDPERLARLGSREYLRRASLRIDPANINDYTDFDVPLTPGDEPMLRPDEYPRNEPSALEPQSTSYSRAGIDPSPHREEAVEDWREGIEKDDDDPDFGSFLANNPIEQGGSYASTYVDLAEGPVQLGERRSSVQAAPHSIECPADQFNDVMEEQFAALRRSSNEEVERRRALEEPNYAQRLEAFRRPSIQELQRRLGSEESNDEQQLEALQRSGIEALERRRAARKSNDASSEGNANDQALSEGGSNVELQHGSSIDTSRQDSRLPEPNVGRDLLQDYSTHPSAHGDYDNDPSVHGEKEQEKEERMRRKRPIRPRYKPKMMRRTRPPLSISDDNSKYDYEQRSLELFLIDGNADLFCFMDVFISSRGNEYFCEIDEEYLTDRFNLTGLNADVQYYQYALDLVTDVFDLDCDEDMREAIEKSARHLYGLVHARYITTTRGLAKMVDKYKKGEFGKCPRVMCGAVHLLPTGMSDIPNTQSVKLYCPKCEDLYNPKSSRHASIDGAYFGSSFQNILFQVYPALVPEKSVARYEPRVFGFKVHASAALQRWQDLRREEMVERLRKQGIENVFVEEVDDGMEEDDDGDDGGEL